MRIFLISIHLLLALFFVAAIVDLSGGIEDDWLGINQSALVVASVMLIMSVVAIWVCYKCYSWAHSYSWITLLIYFIILFLPALMFLGFDLAGLIED